MKDSFRREDRIRNDLQYINFQHFKTISGMNSSLVSQVENVF